MPGTPSFIQLPTDAANTGKKLQTWDNTLSQGDVYAEAVVPVDSTGIEKATAGNPLRIDTVGTTVQPVSGTVTADIVGHAGATLDGTAGSPSTGVLTVQGVGGGTAIPISGTVTTTPSGTTTVAGGLTNNNAAPGANNVGVLPAISNQVAPVETEGDQVLLSQDLNGNQRVILAGVPTVVQKAAFSSTGSVASLACAYTNNVKIGSELIIVASVGNGTTPTIADTLGNNYITAGTYTLGPASAFGLGVWYTKSKTAGANTITVTNGGTTCSIAAQIYEVAGLALGAVPEAVGFLSQTTATPFLPSGINAFTPNDFAILAIAVGTAAQTITLPTLAQTVAGFIANDSGQINPTTPAGLFSFSVASGVVQAPFAFSNTTSYATLGASEPDVMGGICFRAYVQAEAGVVTMSGTGSGAGAFGSGVSVTPANAIPVSMAGANGGSADAMTATGMEAANGTGTLLATSDSVYNGTTWDRARSIQGAASTGVGITAVSQAVTTSVNAAPSINFLNNSGAAISVKASAGNLYGFSITNETAAAAYVEFFNTSAVPTLGTTAVLFAIKLPASSNVTLTPGSGALANFSTGIGFACVTTENGSTTAAVTGVLFFI